MANAFFINQSFNKYGINNPISCGFYVMEVSNKILKEYDLEKITEEVFEEFYNNFLIEKIGKSLTSFIAERVELWSSKEKSFDTDTMTSYVKDTFVKKSYIGIMREQKVLKEIQGYLPTNFSVSHTAPEQDNKSGIDFLIDGIDFKIGIQVKPISFIYGLKSTTKNSLKKIINGKPTDMPLFIITESNDTILVHLKSRTQDKLITMDIQEFLSYLSLENIKEKYSNISQNTLEQMLKIK